MQALEAELYAVSVILWVGTFALLSWLFLRMRGLDNSLRVLASTTGKEQVVLGLPAKLSVYVAAFLEAVGLFMLGLGLIGVVVVPMYPLSTFLWGGVFLLLFWQFESISILEKSIDGLTPSTGEE